MANSQKQPEQSRILYCHCAYARVVPEATKEAVLNRLQASGVAFDAVPDLCAWAANKDDRLQQIAGEQPLKIAACFPRAVRAMFAAAGTPLAADGVEILNMRTMAADDIVAALLEGAGEQPALKAADALPDSTGSPATADQVAAMHAAAASDPENGWIPWFPVLDEARCLDCHQCLSFCLFGVYGLSEDGRVEVQQPHNCKTNCPACARICPEAAIIFPKHETAPINGAEVRPEDLQRESMQVNLAPQLSGNLIEKLRERTAQAKARFSPKQTAEHAAQERQRCLDKFRAANDPSAATPESAPGQPSGDEPPASAN